MSRLRALHIPFVQGFSDEVDAKVLPDGVLRDLRNGRVDRAGSLRLRRGWRTVSLQTIRDNGTDVHTPSGAVDLYSTSRGLVALVSNANALELQTFAAHSTTTPWVAKLTQAVPPVTRVYTVGRMPDFPDAVNTVSSAVTSDGVWGATLEQSATAGFLRVFRLATDETRFFRDVGTDAAKVVSLGTTFGLVDNTGSALRLRTFDPSSSSGAFVITTTLVTVTASHFDAGVAVETTPTRLHLVYTASGAVTYRQFNTSGTEQGSGKTVSASGAQGAWVASDDATVHVAFQDATSDEVSLLSFSATPTFTTAAGPTALNAGTAYSDLRIAIGYTPNSSPARVWVAGGTSDGTDDIRLTASSHASISVTRHAGALLTTGWITRGSYAGIGLVRGSAGSRDAYYTDRDSPWFVQAYALGSNPATNVSPWAPGQAPTGDALAAWPRRSDATAATSRATGQIATRQAGSSAFRVFDTTSRRPGVEFGGALYVAGGMLTQYVSGTATENGFLRPLIESVAQSNSTGTIANGSYRWRAVVVWTDPDGRVHRSPVSELADLTTTGANDTVTATVRVARTMRRDRDATLAPVVELYRTEAGPGELFYHVASTTMTNSSDTVTVIDTLPDASIIDNKRLYTEGEFGEVSGALDIAPGIPSAFVVPVRDRLVLGGADTTYQFSQIALPDEPVAFTQPGFSGPAALAYQDAVEGTITALAALDQTVVIGTARAIFLASADGGPNLAGVGEFSSPVRLPSDLGMPNAASVVEDANGLWFLGDESTGRLYLIGRGQPSPTAVLGARDRFAGGTVVGAAVDIDSDATSWAIADGDDSLLVSRHAQPPNPWFIDDLPFVPRAIVAHGGGLYAIDTSGGVWTNAAGAYGAGSAGATAVVLQAETSDAQVFGQAGHGRLAVIEVLGEFQTAATVGLEISYDMGQSWTAIGTAHTVSGLSVGQAFQRQWRPSRQRGGKFRIRVTMTPSSTTAEGCRLTGLSLYYVPATGPTRLDAAKRR